MRASGRVRVDKYCPRHATVAEKETHCSTQTTVLWRLMEKVNLLVSKLFLAVSASLRVWDFPILKPLCSDESEI